MDGTAAPTTWTVSARNLPEHANNKIHTDEGARAAGFPSALVAGVTTYAYLTHPVVAAWGTEWLERGGGEVRFRAPVIADRVIDCVPTSDPDQGDDLTVAAIDPLEDANPRAIMRAFRDAGPPRPRRAGEALPSLRITLDGEFGADYGARAGDDLEVYLRDGIVHPAVWPALANRVYSTHLIRGSWIHTRSIIRHHGLAPAGAEVDVHATVIERFERHGHRAVTDIEIVLDERPIVTIEHEAIIDLGGS
jgi:acyl dehydratase